MSNARVLWVDDEVDLLKSHMMFLKEKNFSVEAVSNGVDALEMIRQTSYDVVFLDEQMPGMDGLTVLAEIQQIRPNMPVVMVTKSEEEHIMESALGARISDYLIKPVKPNQILLSLKKVLENKRLITAKINSDYQQDFRNIAMQFFEDNDYKDWVDIYRKLTFWDGKMEENEDKSMEEVLASQLSEANNNFGRYISRNYLDWVNTENMEERPMLSHDLLPHKVFPNLEGDHESVFFLLVDCLRYDQWKAFQSILADTFYVHHEEAYYGILPTATQYARNAILPG